MPNLGPFHPQIVHFVVSMLIVGVAFRIVSLTKWFSFTNYGATTLLLIGTVAAIPRIDAASASRSNVSEPMVVSVGP